MKGSILFISFIIMNLFAGTVDHELLYNRPTLSESVAHVESHVASRGGVRVIHAKVTAYAPLDNKSGICADETPKTTSTGKYPKKGIVAVDPKKIPYGTKLYIPGYGEAEAQDTGGALRVYDGVQIDVVLPTYKEAMKWGVKYLDVIIRE